MKSLISVCSRAAAVSFSVVTACDQLSSAPDCSNSRRKITATSAPSAASSSDKKHLPIKASLPVYRKAEVEKHITPEKGIWITHGNGVYDVTDFVANHPGGREKIMLAAGKAVEPYWRLYRQHYNSELPHELLATMKIGTLHAEDAANAQAQFDTSDPYYNDPKLSPVMKQHSTSPINAEAPAQVPNLILLFFFPADDSFSQYHPFHHFIIFIIH